MEKKSESAEEDWTHLDHVDNGREGNTNVFETKHISEMKCEEGDSFSSEKTGFVYPVDEEEKKLDYPLGQLSGIEKADKLLRTPEKLSDDRDADTTRATRNSVFDSLYALHKTDIEHIYVEIQGGPKTGKSSLKSAIESFVCTLPGWQKKGENGRDSLLFRGSDELRISVHSSGSRRLNENDVNICLYALNPHYISEEDRKALSDNFESLNFDMVIPIVCKADTMTSQERNSFLCEVRAYVCACTRLISPDVYAVVCRDREYPWGNVSSKDPSISQLDKLCGNILRSFGSDSTVDEPTHNACLLEKKNFGIIDCVSRHRHVAIYATWLLYHIVAVGCLHYAPTIPVAVCLLSTYIVLLEATVLISPALVKSPHQKTAHLIMAGLIWLVLLFHSHTLHQNETLEKVPLVIMPQDQVSVSPEMDYLRGNLSTCQRELAFCQSITNDYRAVFEETAKRLDKSLDLCGSWCIGV